MHDILTVLQYLCDHGRLHRCNVTIEAVTGRSQIVAASASFNGALSRRFADDPPTVFGYSGPHRCQCAHILAGMTHLRPVPAEKVNSARRRQRAESDTILGVTRVTESRRRVELLECCCYNKKQIFQEVSETLSPTPVWVLIDPLVTKRCSVRNR